jgi:hypothetical protein
MNEAPDVFVGLHVAMTGFALDKTKEQPAEIQAQFSAWMRLMFKPGGLGSEEFVPFWNWLQTNPAFEDAFVSAYALLQQVMLACPEPARTVPHDHNEVTRLMEAQRWIDRYHAADRLRAWLGDE